MTPCGLIEIHLYFRRTYCLYPHGQCVRRASKQASTSASCLLTLKEKVGAFGPCNQNGLVGVVKKVGEFGPCNQSGLEGLVKKVGAFGPFN